MTGPGASDMTDDEAAIARYWRELWTEGRFDVAHEIYAPTYRENLDPPSTPATFAAHAAAWSAHFTNFRVDVDELFTAGNRVISRVTYRGRHTGDIKRVPAQGREFAVSGIDIFEFDGGRVVQHWHETDHLELFRQLGAELGPGAD